MAASNELIERSVALKGALIEFARGPRFRSPLGRAMKERFGELSAIDPAEMANFYDYFLMQYPLSDGRTLVDRFVKEHPELPERERAMLLGWREAVDQVFEVRGPDGPALILFGLVDELTYRVRSQLGPHAFDDTPQGSFILGRLIPVGDEWLPSGAPRFAPASNRDDAYRLAARIALAYPAVLFRNPEKLKQGWELQRQERLEFITFFGSDEVILPGRDVATRMRAFHHFRMHEIRDSEGKSAADRAKGVYGFVPSVPEIEFPDGIRRAQTVGIIYHETEGLHFLANYGLVREAFSRPELASDPRHRDAVLRYLKEPTIPPVALRMLAGRDPQRAGLVFQRLLGKPRFSWERDGETLLRRYKASHFQRPPLPRVVPMSTQLTQARLQRPSRQR